MKIDKKFRIYLYALCLSALLLACGYMPVSKYADSVFAQGVYVELTMNPLMPEASVGAKDAINLAVLTRFKNTLVPKQRAHTIIDMRVNSVSNSPIAYDANGFVSFYRVTVSLSFEVKNDGKSSLKVSNTGYYDYAANSTSAVVIEDSKLNAVTNATTQALDKFISQVAFYGNKIGSKTQAQQPSKELESKTEQEKKRI
ncbi:LPS assembly lipoprotein LptE [Helicobacter himalayensis]|uniref:LPS assembly lipoprotein LptE n=1 Tax=Helicobacter himalayensis TaxID=1591088 RepID=UPI003D6DCEE0